MLFVSCMSAKFVWDQVQRKFQFNIQCSLMKMCVAKFNPVWLRTCKVVHFDAITDRIRVGVLCGNDQVTSKGLVIL